MSISTNRASRGRTLALAWAAVVAMWALAYVALMQPGQVFGETLFALMLLCPVVAGFLAGRDAVGHQPPGRFGRMFSSVVAAAKVGLVIALVNLLIIGSLLVDPITHQPRPNAVWWVLGDLVITIGLVKIGGMFGATRAPLATDVASLPRDWFSLYTRVAAVAVFLLLITGGLVTGLKAGLAVADWPTSFGHNMLLYPLSEMLDPLQRSTGVHYEHAHRLYGMLVGLTAITLSISLFLFDSRRRLRLLGLAVLLMVCVQGYMGGRRVTELSTTLAIIHGVFAQVVFATVVAVAAMTSPAWRAAPEPSSSQDADKTDRTATAALLVLLVLQLALGALYRHLRREADDPAAAMHVLLTHIVVAVLVAGTAVFAAGRAWAFRKDQPLLVRVGKGTIHCLLLQLALGIVAAVLVLHGKDSQAPPYEIALTTAHQAVGALLLAMAALLAMWTRRLPGVRLTDR